MCHALNRCKIPAYFRRRRLVPISKRVGKQLVRLEDIRPIVVRPHLAKVAEKAILAKIKAKHPHLL